METVELAIAFIFGLIFGSFLNVVIYRYDDWRSIATSRSCCPQCQEQLSWFDLIPVVSYLGLRGRCRYCQRPISWQYPVVELATALLSVAFYQLIVSQLGSTGQIALAAAFAVLTIGAIVVIFFHDLYEQMVPDAVAYALLLGAIGLSVTLRGSLLDTFYGLVIGVTPIALLVYPSRGRWMGEGDVKIAAALGALVGYPAAIVYLIFAFLLGALWGLLALTAGRARLKSAVPFAPFLIIAALIAFFWGDTIVAWYTGLIGLPVYLP